ncbi:hypothetical protein QC760_010602 [Botrytis cinerea]
MSDEARKDGETRIALSRRFGACLFSDGRYNEAAVPFVEVMERDKSVFGQEHPSTLTSMANLASTNRNQGRWKEAEDLEVQVMETSLRVLGQKHPDTLNSMNNLALTWKGLGRDKEALKLMEECVLSLTRIISTNHPNTLSSRAILLEWKIHEPEIDP